MDRLVEYIIGIYIFNKANQNVQLMTYVRE